MTTRGRAVALGTLVTLVALALVLQPLRGTRDAEDAARGGAAAGAMPTVQALAPAGEIPRAPRIFVWSSDPVATAYRFELLGRRDLILFTQVTAGTTIQVPSGRVDWNDVAGARWRVTPIEGATDRTPSALVAFRIVSP